MAFAVYLLLPLFGGRSAIDGRLRTARGTTSPKANLTKADVISDRATVRDRHADNPQDLHRPYLGGALR